MGWFDKGEPFLDAARFASHGPDFTVCLSARSVYGAILADMYVTYRSASA